MKGNDMHFTRIGHAVLELLSFKVRSGNQQRGISLFQVFDNLRKYEAHFPENDVTSDKSQFPQIPKI